MRQNRWVFLLFVCFTFPPFGCLKCSPFNSFTWTIESLSKSFQCTLFNLRLRRWGTWTIASPPFSHLLRSAADASDWCVACKCVFCVFLHSDGGQYLSHTDRGTTDGHTDRHCKTNIFKVIGGQKGCSLFDYPFEEEFILWFCNLMYFTLSLIDSMTWAFLTNSLKMN